jgi:hypothetical protein
MAQPTTRQEFTDYCLRKLGAPVIDINLSDEQIDDRIDEAIDFYRDYHYDGSQLVYLKHIMTQPEIDQGWIPVDTNLLGITRIFDLTTTSSGGGMFNVQYQFVLNNMSSMTGYSVVDYVMSMTHLSLLQEILAGKPMIRYNRRIDKLYIDVGAGDLTVGEYIIMEAYDIIDPDVYSDFWKDRWLQNYAATLIKENWGNVLTKFRDVQMVGGTTFNGEQILSDAREERLRMEEQAINTLQPLVHNFIG